MNKTTAIIIMMMRPTRYNLESQFFGHVPIYRKIWEFKMNCGR
ncbi:protein of unknown function [Candidatus Nitrosocosmicus franklandus]|uniref:Uncharacterized protein n=2 Tax=Candidatus Nitrosocosmicus franklandianus TaxID=1798806 RepID=A0A484IBQ3_9ARCH|nr:protein of unknown function [Candidatus Nitrosocosmicus franklandus]